MSRVYVGNIPESMTESELEKEVGADSLALFRPAQPACSCILHHGSLECSHSLLQPCSPTHKLMFWCISEAPTLVACNLHPAVAPSCLLTRTTQAGEGLALAARPSPLLSLSMFLSLSCTGGRACPCSSRAMPSPDRLVPLQFDKFGRISSIWLARRVRTVSRLSPPGCLCLPSAACVACRTALCSAVPLAPQPCAELFAPPSASPPAMVRTRC